MWMIPPLRQHESRRRLIGFMKRKIRWEFWPAWAAYLPLLPYLIYLAIRYRSTTLFTAANPGMFCGGLIGESKSEILRHLNNVPGAVADFVLLPAGATLGVEEFPVVVKPDVGERGTGVAIVRSVEELNHYLQNATGDTIVQRYVPGCEYGIYYVRYPDEGNGRVLYVTEKHFPSVTGDGRNSLQHLILSDPRAVCMASAYLRVAKTPVDSVPTAGQQVQLVEIGSHCRGTVFLNGSHLITRELTNSIDRISQAHPGFHLGRFDVRTGSAEALQRGEFQVIELNGVSAEATHVYDPAVSIREAYQVMAQHWRTAFEIGAINRARGVSAMSARALLRLLLPKRTALVPPPVILPPSTSPPFISSPHISSKTHVA